jgi:phage-related protein
VFDITIYQTADGKQPIADYISALAGKVGTDKDSRIKYEKIDYYLQVLSEYGTRAGEPFVKHIEGDIWELRPLKDRFFFFAWHGNTFVLLHYFVKKTQKTPRREIEQAKRNLIDYVERKRDDEQG